MEKIGSVDAGAAWAQMEQQRTPRLVALLGYGGLLPFVVLAAASALDTHGGTPWRLALLNYAALILSFVGALHWGVAMSARDLSEGQRNACFFWSVMPALLAWSTFLLIPVVASAVLAAGFIAHYLQDWRLLRRSGLPAWYMPLRLRLTAVACLSLLVASLADF